MSERRLTDEELAIAEATANELWRSALAELRSLRAQLALTEDDTRVLSVAALELDMYGFRTPRARAGDADRAIRVLRQIIRAARKAQGGESGGDRG